MSEPQAFVMSRPKTSVSQIQSPGPSRVVNLKESTFQKSSVFEAVRIFAGADITGQRNASGGAFIGSFCGDQFNFLGYQLQDATNSKKSGPIRNYFFLVDKITKEEKDLPGHYAEVNTRVEIRGKSYLPRYKKTGLPLGHFIKRSGERLNISSLKGFIWKRGYRLGISFNQQLVGETWEWDRQESRSMRGRFTAQSRTEADLAEYCLVTFVREKDMAAAREAWEDKELGHRRADHSEEHSEEDDSHLYRVRVLKSQPK